MLSTYLQSICQKVDAYIWVIALKNFANQTLGRITIKV